MRRWPDCMKAVSSLTGSREWVHGKWELFDGCSLAA